LFENFMIAIEAVAPMFMTMLIGVFLKWRKMLTPAEVKKVNKFTFNVFYPFMTFSNIYGAELGEAVDVTLLTYTVIMVLAVFFLTTAVVVKVEPSNRSRGAMIQAIYRSNFVIMGLPIAANICGGNIAVTALAVTIVVPMYNVLAVTILEIFRGGRPDPLHIIKGIAKNPLIIGALLGLLTIPFGIVLPGPVEQVVRSMNNVASPLALLILGMSLDLGNFGEKRNLAICVLGRLVVVPAIVLTGGAMLGIRGVAFVTLIAIFASPTAVASFTMAEQMDSDGPLAANAVVVSSALASITMFGWIFLFKCLGMF